MSITLRKLLQEAFAGKADELRRAYLAEGFKASGRWGRDLQTDIVATDGEKTAATLRAAPYTHDMIRGTPPRPLTGSQFLQLVKAIEQWTIDKQIPARGNRQRLARSITRYIAQHGTRRWRQGGSDLLERILPDGWPQETLDRAIDQQRAEAIQNLLQQYQALDISKLPNP